MGGGGGLKLLLSGRAKCMSPGAALCAGGCIWLIVEGKQLLKRGAVMMNDCSANS